MVTRRTVLKSLVAGLMVPTIRLRPELTSPRYDIQNPFRHGSLGVEWSVSQGLCTTQNNSPQAIVFRSREIEFEGIAAGLIP